MVFKKWWGMTVFKLFAIIYRSRPCTSFSVGLTSSHVVRLIGFMFVPMLGIITALECVAIFHLLSMSPAIFIRRRVESSPTLSVSPFLFEECIDLLQCTAAKFSAARHCWEEAVITFITLILYNKHLRNISSLFLSQFNWTYIEQPHGGEHSSIIDIKSVQTQTPKSGQ
jgi:hypothetical protein